MIRTRRFSKVTWGLSAVTWLVATLVSAAEIQMVRVNSDAVPGKDLDIRVLTDNEGAITHLRYTSPESTRDFAVAGLAQGLVLMEHSGRVVVRLVAKNFDAQEGGVVNMDYLVNGVTGARANYPIVMIRQGADWKVYAELQNKRVFFTRMYLKAKKVLGQIVGVDKITVSP